MTAGSKADAGARRRSHAAATTTRPRPGHHYQIQPLVQRPVWKRLDVLPFAVTYAALIWLDWSGVGIGGGGSGYEDDYPSASLLLLTLLPLTLLLQLALALACTWRVSTRALVGYERPRPSSSSTGGGGATTGRWTHVLVAPPVNQNGGGAGGGAGIASVVVEERVEGGGSSAGSGMVLTVDFRSVRFRYCPDGTDDDMDGIWTLGGTTSASKATAPASTSSGAEDEPAFHGLHYPCDLPLAFYEGWTGHSDASPTSTLARTERIYGTNAHPIPIPPITQLLLHQLLQPFFLFQLLCVMLWSLDEYWYYAIFTLFTLILFEWTVAYNRLKSLQRLRETLRPVQDVWTYRGGLWGVVRSDTLVAGDVVSMDSTDKKAKWGSRHDHEGGRHIPCDVLLLKGGAVVNEAVLTGESVPQIKEGVANLVQSASSADVRLDIEDPSHKRSVLFGGTLLVNHNLNPTEDNGTPGGGGIESIPSPPDGGLTTMVLRTGFDTVQGSLLRTMVNSTVTTASQNSDGVNTTDTYVFIALLLLCALASSILVLNDGWHDPTRNRFKLVLHVVIIITSVVPPELPMELSLAVTASIADLIQRCNVYCTEPWRIPLAGKVDVCCFDKTGTLTSDEMMLRGVRLPVVHEQGKVVIACRDGTVTGGNDDLVVPTGKTGDQEEGAQASEEEGLEGGGANVKPAIPIDSLRVLVACHGLSTQPSPKTRGRTRDVIGDPLEKAVLSGCGWELTANDTVSPPLALLVSPNPPQSGPKPIRIRHRYAFTSKLRRMTVLASEAVMNSGKKPADGSVWVLTKGAPETVRTLLNPSSIPSNYDQVASHHMGLGQRVLALACRKIASASIPALKGKREDVEKDLSFAGFLVLDCPLKPDSKRIVKELKESGHQTKMITGDAVLTAVEVARQVGIVGSGKKKKGSPGDSITYELRNMEQCISGGDDEGGAAADFVFVPLRSTLRSGVDLSGTKDNIAYVPSNLTMVRDMVRKGEITVCITGDVLTMLAVEGVRKAQSGDSYIDGKNVLLHPAAQSALRKLVPIVAVFARHAPRQKEAVIMALNGAGHVTLMCGDGTNDVGALKMAHVGISIVSVPDLEAKQRKAMKGVDKIREEEKRDKKLRSKKKKGTKGNDRAKKSVSAVRERKATLEESFRALAEAEEELNFVALGDASVASPFTSRTMSIKCTKDILQRGRCTLVTMLQIYKILGVNCLVNALVLTRLHMDGVKQGDRQLTAVGIVVAALFFFVTKGKPVPTLSPRRPPSSVMCRQALLSICVQFSIHFACIIAITTLATAHLDPEDPSLVPDGSFNPNALNTATFLLSTLATVNTFVVNYHGQPYMEDLVDNKVLLRSVQVCYGALFICALEVFPPLNQLLQLTPLPSHDDVESRDGVGVIGLLAGALGLKLTLCTVMVIDSVLAYMAEKAIGRLF